MFLCGSRRTGEIIHNSWVMWYQLFGFFLALAYILNIKSLVKAANYLIPSSLLGFSSGDSSFIVAKPEYQKTVTMYKIAQYATFLIDYMLECGVAFMSLLSNRTISEIHFSL